ncbi:MAG: phytase [Gemmatimonadaceae bacterium]
MTACSGGARVPADSVQIATAQPGAAQTTAALPISMDTLQPAVITDTVPVDSDDPGIWVNRANPAQSFVVGTDKGDTNGGVYVFGLDGKIDHKRSVTPLQRMNNVDVEYGMAFGATQKDIAVGTERRRMMLRVFSLPEMKLVDGGGIPVFDRDTSREPMGIALYKRPRDGQIFAIVGGKSGPTNGTYLAQYALKFEGGKVTGTKVREFGNYSGKKEIEAILVDDALGYVYYSDEGFGVRKYYADPDSSSKELAVFATTGVKEDHEGLAIYAKDAKTGYIVLSDQGANRIHVFPREGANGNPNDHPLLAILPVRAQQTDGLDITNEAMGPSFPHGMLAMMSNRGAFHFYKWEDVQAAIDKVLTSKKP